MTVEMKTRTYPIVCDDGKVLYNRAWQGVVEMKESELPPFAQRAIEGMQQSVRQKWCEAATGFFLRAVTNYQTGEACREAGFTDAAVHFAKRCTYYLAQGLYCLAQMNAVERLK